MADLQVARDYALCLALTVKGIYGFAYDLNSSSYKSVRGRASRESVCEFNHIKTITTNVFMIPEHYV